MRERGKGREGERDIRPKIKEFRKTLYQQYSFEQIFRRAAEAFREYQIGIACIPKHISTQGLPFRYRTSKSHLKKHPPSARGRNAPGRKRKYLLPCDKRYCKAQGERGGDAARESEGRGTAREREGTLQRAW